MSSANMAGFLPKGRRVKWSLDNLWRVNIQNDDDVRMLL